MTLQQTNKQLVHFISKLRPIKSVKDNKNALYTNMLVSFYSSQNDKPKLLDFFFFIICAKIKFLLSLSILIFQPPKYTPKGSKHI